MVLIKLDIRPWILSSYRESFLSQPTDVTQVLTFTPRAGGFTIDFIIFSHLHCLKWFYFISLGLVRSGIVAVSDS